MENNRSVSGSIVVDPFIVNSTSCNLYILYLIALDITRQDGEFMKVREPERSTAEVGKLCVKIHNSAFVSISYTAEQGFGFELPRFVVATTATATTGKQSYSLLDNDDNRQLSRCHHQNSDKVEKICDAETTTTAASLETTKLYENIQTVGDRIVRLMNDVTIRPQAYAIAQYLLLEDLDRDTLLEKLAKPGAKELINKLLDCESDFLSPMARSLGVDIISYIVADKIQKSLDVKHIHIGMNSKSLDRIIPNIKPIILHTHPAFIWIRFYAPYTEIDIDANVIRVCENVYEIYLEKTKTVKSEVSETIKMLERDWDADIIFCSELAYFSYNKLLFISNYIKFTWCYCMNRNIFDPKSHEDIKALCIYMMYGFLFLRTTNLTNMPQDTHNPLIAYTGERPRIVLKKFSNNTLYNAEGSRAMHSINKNSDFGSRSNFIEIINTIEFPANVLKNII